MRTPFLDTELAVRFHHESPHAKKAAELEAANSGGLVLSLIGLEIEETTLALYAAATSSSAPPSIFQDRAAPTVEDALGTLHLTWRGFFEPTEAPLGYLVVHRPLPNGCKGDEREDSVYLRFRVPRCRHSLKTRVIGLRCCTCCFVPIPLNRLQAVPTTTQCVKCKSAKEVGR